jgi:L-lactate dehydrogenase complex protein LldG
VVGGPGVTAREEVLARIRTALGDGGGAPDEAPRAYRTSAGLGTPTLIGLLTERLHDYGTSVRRCAPDEVPAAVRQALADRGARRVVLPAGLDLTGPGGDGPGGDGPGDGGLDGVTLIGDDDLSPAALDAADGVVTTAALAIAETGTIVLDGGPGQGRRALSLIPDYHLCIVRTGQIVGIVPEALGRLDPGRPQTWISGPSATSDIELDRVQGVHGPRTLEVILAGP